MCTAALGGERPDVGFTHYANYKDFRTFYNCLRSLRVIMKRASHLSERESLCAVKKLHPFLLLHSPKQVTGFKLTLDLANTDLPGRIKLAKMVSPIPC